MQQQRQLSRCRKVYMSEAMQTRWLLLTEDINNWPAGLEAHALHLRVHTSEKVIADHCVLFLPVEILGDTKTSVPAILLPPGIN